MDKLKVVFAKIISFVLIAALFISFVALYFFSLVLIKPRDITKVVDLVKERYIPDSQSFNIKSKRVLLLWNKKEFSFDINFFDNQIALDQQKISLPHLVLDIDRKNLLLGKFNIDGIKIPEINYQISKQDLYSDDAAELSNINKEYIADLTEKLLSNIAIVKSVEIAKLNINDKQNNKLISLRNFYYKYSDGFLSKKLRIDFSLEKNNSMSELSALCHLKNLKEIDDCRLDIQDLNLDILNKFALADQISGYSNLRLLVKNIDGSYKLKIDPIIRSLSFIYEDREYYYSKLFVTGEGVIESDNYRLNNFYIVSKNKNLILNSEYNSRRNDLTLDIKGKNLDQNDAILLWPRRAGINARKWLKKSMKNAFLKHAEIALSLNLNKKKPLKSIIAKFDFEDFDLDFSKKMEPVYDASGVAYIVNKRLDVIVKEAFIGEGKVENIRAYIPLMAKGKSELFIKSKINNDSQSIVAFLARRNLSDTGYNKLNEYFDETKISGDLDLSLQLKPKFSSDMLKLNFTGELNGNVKNYLSKESKVKLEIDKNYDDRNFYHAIDLADAKITTPIFAYDKDYGIPLSGNFSVLKSNQGIEFNDILIKNNQDVVKGNILGAKKIGIAKLNLDKVKLGENQFSLKMDHINDFLSGSLLASNFILKKDILDDFKSEGGGVSFFDLNYQMDNLSFEHIAKQYKGAGKLFCKKKCELFYNEAQNGDDKIFFRLVRKDNKNSIIVEANNLGVLLNDFNISDKLISGDFRLSADQQDSGSYEGKIYSSNFLIRQTNFFKEILEERSLIKKNVSEIPFEKGELHFNYHYNHVEISNAIFYGNLLGMSAEGWLNFHSGQLKIKGAVIPAYKINNLLGIKDIPVLGKVFTGSKKEGVFSAKYDIRGDIKNPKFKINTLSAVIPSSFRKAASVLTPRYWQRKFSE